jgi:uncharacterized repeat protein (TIGR01451 family)
MPFLAWITLLLTTSTAYAETISFNDSIPLQTVDWEESLTLSKFPEGLGALTAIDITIEATIDGQIRIENLNTNPATIGSVTDINVAVRRPDGTTLMTSIANSKTSDDFTAFDESEDFAGMSGKTYTITEKNTDQNLLTNLSQDDITLFSGIDTISLPVTAIGNTNFTGIGHLSAEANIAASAHISVTYTYTKPDLMIQMIPGGAFQVGAQSSYTLIVRNVGVGPTADTITIRDPLPTGFDFVSASGADWDCSESSRIITCTHNGPLTSEISLPVINVTVAITTRAYPSVSKTVAVSTRGDTDTSNNSATTGILVADPRGLVPEEEYESPNYSFEDPSFDTPSPSVSSRVVSRSENVSRGGTEGPGTQDDTFQFEQHHGAFGGPKTQEGTVIYDAQGCAISEEWLTVQEPQNICAPISVPIDFGFTREEVVRAALESNCIPFHVNVMGAARNNGIITAKERPADRATNEEILTILLRAAGVMPKGYDLQSALNWVAPYLHFARLHHIVPLDFQRNETMDWREFVELISNVAAIRQSRPHKHNDFQIAAAKGYKPITSIGRFTPISGTTCEDRDPHIISCLAYDPWRDLTFTDIDTSPSIDLVKRTHINPHGDYIFSGHGNHSATAGGTYEFQPNRPATRLEIVKIALVSNCIPILPYLPRGTIEFTDIHKGFLNDPVHDFTARVFYTAALHGIIKGYPDGSARPHKRANGYEAMAILMRSAGIANTDSADLWYQPYESFASTHHFLPPQTTQLIHRDSLVNLLIETMKWSSDIRVRAYMTSVNALLK